MHFHSPTLLQSDEHLSQLQPGQYLRSCLDNKKMREWATQQQQLRQQQALDENMERQRALNSDPESWANATDTT